MKEKELAKKMLDQETII